MTQENKELLRKVAHKNPGGGQPEKMSNRYFREGISCKPANKGHVNQLPKGVELFFLKRPCFNVYDGSDYWNECN